MLAIGIVLVGASALCGCSSRASTAASNDASPARATTVATADISRSATVQQILAQARTAMGGAARSKVHSMRITATTRYAGLTGSARTLTDLSTGQWIAHVTLGPVQVARGFDGKSVWTQTSSGKTSTRGTAQARKHAVTTHYQRQMGWWHPKRFPAAISSLGTRKNDGESFQVLRVAPRGGVPFKMWINTRTHFITRFVQATRSGSSATLLSDFRSVDGMQMAFHREVRINKHKQGPVIQITSVKVNVPVKAADFAMPKSHGHDFSLINGGDKATMPFQLVDGRVYLGVTIDGHSLHLMLDSGGPNNLTPRAARALGIAGEGALPMSGEGSQHQAAALTKIKQLQIGGKVDMHNQLFTIASLSGGMRTWKGLDGAIGAKIFKDFVVRIDYGDRQVTLIRPASFNADNAGTPVPIQIMHGHPVFKGTINGVPGLFVVDTGNTYALVLNARFARNHKLYSRFNAGHVTRIGHGYGGVMRARKAYDGKLAIGPVTVNVPVVDLSTATSGLLVEKHRAGRIGGAILRHFTVTFDYADQTMYLKANGHDESNGM